ncbi:50S ribosomal protein L6, chloroplastic-like isoform X3 [Malus sylvestris]|uniref:50S ribosomal protein L6, chloroplastic-like isoform X3 n=1 Tax=Malus sylvestris TaxID=3752 RepID=UPI0021AB9FA3|nr:50S ribosomal protein L6, chloroplastic-like isoform X3 [Malus sylvestris]
MASSLTSSFQTSNLPSAFLGERNGFSVCSVSVSHVRFLKKTIECKESRIGKQPIEVPSNVTITLEGQTLAVKGPLGQLSLTYPQEVLVQEEDSGALRVRKAVETSVRTTLVHISMLC